MNPTTPPNKQEVEKQLIPRLRFVGLVLLFFSVFSISYSVIDTPYLSTVGIEEKGLPQMEESSLGIDLEPEEKDCALTPCETINLFLIAAIFATVGSTCLFIAWKRDRKQLPSEGQR